MDRALKERIIGAIVLVMFVVLVVPIFLDGPTTSDEIISEQVPLPGQAGNENSTVVLARDRTQPVPGASSSAAPPEVEPPSRPVATQREATPPPQPDPEPAQAETETGSATAQDAPVASTTGMWAVQMGSFGSAENAEKLAADLRKRGFAAFLSKLSTNSGELHRVRIGPQKDRESAEAMAEQLRKAGFKGQVVPHP